MDAGWRHVYGDMESCFIFQPQLLKTIARSKNCLASLAKVKPAATYQPANDKERSCVIYMQVLPCQFW